MARFKGLVAQNLEEAALQEEALAAPRVVRNAKLEEGEAKGDGWVALRSLLLLVGGMILVSYLIFSM